MPQMVPFQADAASPLWAHLESLGLLGNYGARYCTPSFPIPLLDCAHVYPSLFLPFAVAFSAQTAAARSAAEAAACERGARKRCREEEE